MHPYFSQSLIDVMIADRHQRAAADRRAREARAAARTSRSRAAHRHVAQHPVPIENAVPVQRQPLRTAQHSVVGAASRSHSATAVGLADEHQIGADEPQMCGAAR